VLYFALLFTELTGECVCVLFTVTPLLTVHFHFARAIDDLINQCRKFFFI